ncbi:predicted protein [Nematostella vectensis]|uniref:DOMON domain-containing protein n=1 Tax=Nematostella vectensis TaxID=45351 RepID=A7RFN8_NEMVE|nr:predicted protein [Nematostella vectensis]|eukprot:XP_001641697.1 predicted protein [Nematostella vectensis]
MQLCVVLLALCGVSAISAASLASEYNHFAALDDNQWMKLYWSINHNAKTISFALEAETTGWVGFGISSGSGMMKGADIVIGWVKDGKAFLTDRYADGEYMPKIDDHNDYKLISGTEENGKTILKFSRKIDTCDPRDRKIKIGTTKVIWALDYEDPQSENDMRKHRFRGSRSVLMLNSQGNSNPPDPAWSHFDILMNNYTVPARHTTYSCHVFTIPKFTKKHHIVRFDPVVQSENAGIVHHFIVMACDKDFPEHLSNDTSECTDEANMPAEVLKCRGRGVLVGAWGVGGGPFVYPDHVGSPLGLDFQGRYFVMEVHYNNPDKLAGKIDNSGVRFFYTDSLRKYDAGVLNVGASVTPWMLIPPKQKEWTTTTYCNKRCNENVSVTQKSRRIKFFSAFLHTHLAGRATWTKHVRNGVELPEIARDDNYDFNFQDIQFLNKEVHFLPGDELIHECVYNTMDRTGVTFGGEATNDEMCLNFMFYYPFIPEMSRVCGVVDLKAAINIVDKYYP